MFPNTIDVKYIKNIKETLENSHGVQNPQHQVIHEAGYQIPKNAEYIFSVDFNNKEKQLPINPSKTKTLLNYRSDVYGIHEKFHYLYPIIAMRESLFRYDKKYPNTLQDFLKQYLQDIQFIGQPHKAFNQHVFNLFPWNDVYYAWYNHSKVIHYYNILFLLFQVGGDINENSEANIVDLHNIPFVDETKKQVWQEVCKSFDKERFYDEFDVFNNPLDYNDHTYTDQKHIKYDKRNINDVSLMTVRGIETNITYLRHKVHKFLKKIGELTLDNYNVLSNWNYSLISGNKYVDMQKVFKNLQKFSLYQVQCIEASPPNYKFRFKKEFTLEVGISSFNLKQHYNCMHQHMPKDEEGIPLNTKNKEVKVAVKEVIDFDNNVKLYDDWVGPLLTKMNEKLGKENMPNYEQQQKQTIAYYDGGDLSLERSEYLLM